MTKEHILDYDGFAIGLKKDWGIAHGLNPVFYINEIGLTVTIEKLTYGAYKDFDGKTGFEHMACYLKQINGYDHKTGKKKYFYNEREWRFVPMLSLFPDSHAQFYNEKDFPSDLNKEIIGHRLYKLDFNVSDVEYVIVKTNDRKQDIINVLMDSEYSESIIKNTVRVFSMEEVFENF